MTLVELLRERARRSPERWTYVFLRDGEREEARLANGEIDRRARSVAALLQRVNARGERALLLIPTSPEFVGAFFGCLYAGVVAVPAPAPGRGRLTRDLPRLRAIIRDAQPRLVLTTSRVHAMLPSLIEEAPDLAALLWVAVDTQVPDDASQWRDPRVDADTIAFLQYTSGSTADPKGVVITHANIVHNQASIQDHFETTEDTVGVGWLPLHHDMGLVGLLVGTLYGGGRAILMSPDAFLQQPVRWLSAITRYRGDISGGPNFAYEHCVRSITPAQRATLDLSTWSLAFTGAEPVRAETLERFAETFGPHGFRREAFYPCYGLAESTLLAAGGRRHAAPVVRVMQSNTPARGRGIDAVSQDGVDGVRHVVGCGRAPEDARIAIVDPETRGERPPGEIGEIWLSSPSVGRGYWNRDEETERTFHGRIAGVDDRWFLRTGDLGFLDDGELFVTGRLKELIIIDGRNHYPQDVERTAEAAAPALRPGACAAFCVEAGGEERLVIVAELQRGPLRDGAFDDIRRAIRSAVAEGHGVGVHAVRLVKPGGVPRTSSGKLRRLACRDAFLTGMLDVVGGEHVQPA